MITKHMLYESRLNAAYQIYLWAGYPHDELPTDELITTEGYISWALDRHPEKFLELSKLFREAVQDVLFDGCSEVDCDKT